MTNNSLWTSWLNRADYCKTLNDMIAWGRRKRQIKGRELRYYPSLRITSCARWTVTGWCHCQQSWRSSCFCWTRTRQQRGREDYELLISILYLLLSSFWSTVFYYVVQFGITSHFLLLVKHIDFLHEDWYFNKLYSTVVVAYYNSAHFWWGLKSPK